MNANKAQILIVGGGTAGLTVAAQLMKHKPNATLSLIEPSDKHYYQPLWTLVGGGVFNREESMRQEKDLIPPGVNWIKDSVASFQPEENKLTLSSGKELNYDYLVVAPGLQIDWQRVRGLEEAIGKDGVCSIYDYRYAPGVWENINKFKGGNAIFTVPSTPIKCGGAPQKIMYMADDTFANNGVKAATTVSYVSAQDSIFAVPKYAATLNKVIERRGIETKYKHNLVEVRPASKEAVFERLDTKEQVILPYDLLHVVPPMKAPDFIAKSSLADPDGWVNIDKHSLRHKSYNNIFSLGDASNLPTSKTGAAIRKQAPVVVANLLSSLNGKELSKNYDGYTSCPLITGYGKLVLAEFDYDKKPQETFPFDQSKERLSMYLLKAYLLPQFYWNAMLKGRG